MLAAAIMLLSVSVDSPPEGSALLSCSVSAEQSDPRTMRDFYRTPPLAEKQFVRDVWDHGLMQLVIAPSKGWHIDFDKRMITELDSNFPTLNITEISSHSIVAESVPGRPTRKVTFSRVTGHATLFVMADVTAWNSKFGSALRPYRTWDFDCAPARPKF